MARSIRTLAIAAAATLALAGAAQAATALPTFNTSPMDPAARCLLDKIVAQKSTARRIAVGDIKDYTGKLDIADQTITGKMLTDGGSLMASTALGKMNGWVREVERQDTDIMLAELKLTQQGAILDVNDVRKPTAYRLQGSEAYIVGGITEANSSIESGLIDATIAGSGIKARTYSMTVAVDLRLVNSLTGDVLDHQPIRIKVSGKEIRAGVFSFFNTTRLYDINAGIKNDSPMGLAVRAAIERATYELVANYYGVDYGTCRPVADAALSQ